MQLLTKLSPHVANTIDIIDKWHTSDMFLYLKTFGKLVQMLLVSSVCILVLIYAREYGRTVLIFVWNQALPLSKDWLHRHWWGREGLGRTGSLRGRPR
jgi:hypothetical protein